MDYQSLIERKLEPRGVSNTDIIYRCPECEGVSGSGHLYVDYDKEYWHCFHCGVGGRRLESLMSLLHISLDYDYTRLADTSNKELDAVIAMGDDPVPVIEVSSEYSTNIEVLTDYYDLHTMPLSQTAYDYLLARGLTPDTIEILQLREGLNRYGESININHQHEIGRDYSQRIMVPSRRKDGLISYYVARDYTGHKSAKYLNPPKSLAVGGEDVWNLDMVDSDSVIICEGVFTAIAASPYKLNSVATYGKSIAKSLSSTHKITSQAEKLLHRRFSNYYVCYDADATSESLYTCQYLYDRGARVYLIYIDAKQYGEHADVADIGFTEFCRLLSEAPQYKGELTYLFK